MTRYCLVFTGPTNHDFYRPRYIIIELLLKYSTFTRWRATGTFVVSIALNATSWSYEAAEGPRFKVVNIDRSCYLPYISSRGHQLFYESHGSGEPMLLISGTGWNGSHWAISQVPFFEKNYEVITFDHRGTGRSDCLDQLYSTDMFANDVIDLLDSLRIDHPVHVLGHSMGGKIALCIAIDQPNRVRSLILAATSPGPVDNRSRPASISASVIESIMKEGWPNYFENRLNERMLFYRDDPLLVAKLRKSLSGEGKMDLLSYMGHILARQGHSSVPRLGEVQHPCLVVVGEEDEIEPSCHLTASKLCFERIPNAELVVLPDTAHALHIESSDLFNESVAEFLRGV